MKAFEELYQEYYPKLNAFLFNLCKDTHLAEELTQETFYQAFISIHRFRSDAQVFTWLASIGKHVYYKYLRKNKLHIESINLELFAGLHGGFNTEDTVQDRLAAERVREVIRTLPQKYIDVVVLRVYADLPFSQVAKALNISENSAKVIFFRAKKKLMEELDHASEL